MSQHYTTLRIQYVFSQNYLFTQIFEVEHCEKSRQWSLKDSRKFVTVGEWRNNRPFMVTVVVCPNIEVKSLLILSRCVVRKRCKPNLISFFEKKKYIY